MQSLALSAMPIIPIKITGETAKMKKTTLLQSDLSYMIATLGHLDTLVMADAGLPIPAETVRIDLALYTRCTWSNSDPEGRA
jgi:hypothetical protein